MRRIGGLFELSATDLVGHLNCRHLTQLDRAVAEGRLAKPHVWDPLLQVLARRGSIHEEEYVRHLSVSGLDAVRIDAPDVSEQAVSATLAAMRRGVPVIAQGALSSLGWIGRPDILRRREVPSTLGNWQYEPIDTKLARETKAGTILQLSLYADLLAEVQGAAPEYMYVVVPWSAFEPEAYRFADYAAYFRKVKASLRKALDGPANADTYPDPKPHCDICRWREACDKRRRDDDHLSLVAGISKLQIVELNGRGITTARSLAGMTLPLDWKPGRGSAPLYVRAREQARLQLESRETGILQFELLPVEKGFGLACLPEPSHGDLFFDLEGDPFVSEEGLEYLFGYVFEDANGERVYRSRWAFSRADEKSAFEEFIDFVIARLAQFPDLHIYH
jgi:uncharacterized protein